MPDIAGLPPITLDAAECVDNSTLCDGKRSRYGRQQRIKEPKDFLPTELVCGFRSARIKKVPQPETFPEQLIAESGPLEIDEPVIDTIDIRRSSEISINNASEISSCKSNDLQVDDERLKIGTILWSKIGTYPYWPCIICADIQNKIFSRFRGRKKNNFKIHVRFFADNGRRSWVLNMHSMLFEALQDIDNVFLFNELAASNRQSFKAGFVIPKRYQVRWQEAVKEAQATILQSVDERESYFIGLVEAIRKKKDIVLQQRRSEALDKIEKTQSKRTRSISPDNISEDTTEQNFHVAKRFCPENSSTPILQPYSTADMSAIVASYFNLSNNNRVKSKSLTKNLVELIKSQCNAEENHFFANSPKMKAIDECEFSKLFDIIKLRALHEMDKETEEQIRSYMKQMWLLRKSKNSDKNVPKIELEELENTDVQSVSTEHSYKQMTSVSKKKHYLFEGLRKEFVCRICKKPNDLVRCDGKCSGFYHKKCFKSDNTDNTENTDNTDNIDNNETVTENVRKFRCDRCKTSTEYPCFICKQLGTDASPTISCNAQLCGRLYHPQCLKRWPQSKFDGNTTKKNLLFCPYHVCHTCVSDNPREKIWLEEKRQKLVKCVECPTAYHFHSSCIPAGSKLITATQIVCIKHEIPKTRQLNANWCFICASGGHLVCCETCPAAFHLECLKISPPDGNYVCYECEAGRMPLYGEIVWAKLGTYRWWPARIVPPPDAPRNLSAKPQKLGYFIIYFYGSKNFSWIHRSRVFLFQEGDGNTEKIKRGKLLDSMFNLAVTEAIQSFDQNKVKRSVEEVFESECPKPLPYVQIKTNRLVAPVKMNDFDEEEITKCDCDPNDITPCGADSLCLNRMLQSECNRNTCPGGKNCQNQRFEKRLYPSLGVRKTEGRGWGLVALETIFTGAFVIEYVGEIIDNEELKRRLHQKQIDKDENYYFLNISKDLTIDAGPKGNVARFMNHSCEPNCETQKWTVNEFTRIGLFAIQDIPPNTELTFNYNLKSIGNEKKMCQCGAERCAKFIGGKFKIVDKPLLSIEEKPRKKRRYRKKIKANISKLEDSPSTTKSYATISSEPSTSSLPITADNNNQNFDLPKENCEDILVKIV